MGSETRARLALGGLAFVTLLTFGQLFDHGDYFGPALLGILLATGLALGARRLGAGSPSTLLVVASGMAWYLMAVFESPRLAWRLPTPAAAAALIGSLAHARDASRLDFAPIPARTGYVVLVVAAMWVAAGFGEVATFRWRRPLLASVPFVALVAVALVVGTGRGATLLIVLFLCVLLTYWAMESSWRLRSWGRWVAGWSHVDEVDDSVTGGVARRMGASCIAAALVAPLLLPALDRGLVAWRSGIGGPGAGGPTTIDLLVSLAPTLVNQTNERLFTVRSDLPTYWRLTSLAEFDGRDWKVSDSNLQPVRNGRIETYEPIAAGTKRLAQRFTMTGLGNELLPAAVQPDTIALRESTRTSAELMSDPDTGELRLPGGLIDGLTYDVVSRVPNATYRAMRHAAIGQPPPAYTELPQLSDAVYRLVDRWTAGRSTPFDKLVAIQDRLRSFEYSTKVRPEDSADYLTEFLTRTRAGFCQQFATAFAILARALGYPTRVSVGFLPGSASPTHPGEYVVTGANAHAWPEVYFRDFGWVAFEPTPRPSAEQPAYTIPALGSLGGARGGGSGANGGGNANVKGSRHAGEAPPGGRALPPLTTVGRPARHPAWARAFGRVTRAGLLVLAVLLGLVPALKEYRIRAGYRRARGAVAEARAAFAHFEREATDLASPRRVGESASAYAGRLGRDHHASGSSARALAAIFETAEYSPDGVSPERASRARGLARDLRRDLWSRATWLRRARRLFSPRGLLPALARPWWPRGRRPLPAH